MRSGQFFTLALIIFSGIILTAVAFTNSFDVNFGSEQIAQTITDHNDQEIGYTVSAAAESETGPAGQLLAARAFSGFREYMEIQRSIDTDSRYLIGTPTDSGLNISATNLGDGPLTDSWVTVDGTGQYLGTIPEGDSNITAFTTDAEQLTVTWNGSDTSGDYTQTFDTPKKGFIYLDSASSFGSSIFSDAVLY